MRTKAVIFLFMILSSNPIMAQMHQKESEKGFRMVGVIGHTLVNTNQLDNVWVPSWGLDLEYWFNAKWGIGLHNDVEMETFVVKNAAQDEIVRVNPLVFTIDALYHFGHGFVATLGPGIEIERTESFYLLRFGMEYEKDINESLYIMPNVFVDQRFDGYNTFNIGLGIGMRL
jgi:hypothetical protein